MRTFWRGAFGVGLGLLMAISAEGMERADESNRIDDLVLGDTYVVEATRNGVSEKHQGVLTHVDDEWLTIAIRVRGRNEFGVPVLSKTPYVNRLFKNVGIGEERSVHCLVRESTKIVGRTKLNPSETPITSERQRPEVDHLVTIHYEEGGKVATMQGTLKSLNDEEAVLTTQTSESHVSRVPVLSSMPLVGDVFTRTTVTVSEFDSHIAAEKIMSVNMSDANFFERKPDNVAQADPDAAATADE